MRLWGLLALLLLSCGCVRHPGLLDRLTHEHGQVVIHVHCGGDCKCETKKP